MSASESKKKGPLAGLLALVVAVLGALGYWQFDGLSPKSGPKIGTESAAEGANTAADPSSGSASNSGADSPVSQTAGAATNTGGGTTSPPKPSTSADPGSPAATPPQASPPPASGGSVAPPTNPKAPLTDPDRPQQLVVEGPRGATDLAPTLRRIERGEAHEHRNDGATFQNREGRLPKRARGHYTEYVHPTPGVRGPGARRVVLGKDGEVYYTPDHYESFQKMRWRLEMGNGK